MILRPMSLGETPKTCVFCGGGRYLTNTFGPNGYKPTSHEPFRSECTASFSGTLHAERIWNGDMLTDTIPCVCERCNSGWMSRLQTRAKPHIVPFLQATWPTLDRWASRSLAAWITMFTMVYEFRAPRTAAIPSKQRDTFRRTRDPIDGWEIWIAKINPNRWRGSHHARCRNPLRPEAFTTQREARPSNHDRCDRQSAFSQLLLCPQNSICPCRRSRSTVQPWDLLASGRQPRRLRTAPFAFYSMLMRRTWLIP